MRVRAPSPPVAGLLLLLTCLSLIVLHGMKWFTVDAVTLGLIGFGALPYLRELVASFKAGGVEVSLRDLTVSDQLFVFLDSIARRQRWTFYRPRRLEDEPGTAFRILAQELLRLDRPRFVDQIRSWLRSDDKNLRWFGAEVVGAFRLDELRSTVGRARITTDKSADLEEWELNCLWAESRCETPAYTSLLRYLQQSTSVRNQAWILEALDQMVDAKEATGADFSDAIREFVRKHTGPDGLNASLAEVFGGMRHLKL